MLSQLNSSIAHFVITGMSDEERMYLAAMLESCVEDDPSEVFEDSENESDLQNTVGNMFKNSVQNITRQELNLIVSKTLHSETLQKVT